jgi:hypothetical protein
MDGGYKVSRNKSGTVILSPEEILVNWGKLFIGRIGQIVN